jgi:hypothetical protein
MTDTTVAAATLQTIPREKWPTIDEAAALLETSIRTIWRHNERGKLEIQKRPVPGRKPVNICNPRDIDRLMPDPYVVANGNSNVSNGKARSPIDVIAERLAELLNKPTLQAANVPILPAAESSAEIGTKLWLTLPEAAQFTSLSETYLRKIIKDGPLISCRGGKNGAVVISRSSLEKMGQV